MKFRRNSYCNMNNYQYNNNNNNNHNNNNNNINNINILSASREKKSSLPLFKVSTSESMSRLLGNFAVPIIAAEALVSSSSSSLTSSPSSLLSVCTLPRVPPQLQQLQPHHYNKQQQQQPQRQKELNNFFKYKMPNLSFLYMILMILSFLSLFLPSTNAQTSRLYTQPLTNTNTYNNNNNIMNSNDANNNAIGTAPVRLERKEHVCRTMDVRNNPTEFEQLENCTVIEGFLLITLIHKDYNFTKTYPLLTEVTDYIIVTYVHNLRSLAQIFPNLSIIRGNTLFEGYALAVYSNPHLESLGLSKLTTISRGGVRIEYNQALCFAETIAWDLITNSTDIVIQKNRDNIECPQCPGDVKLISQEGIGGISDSNLVCNIHLGQRRCWSSKTCQTICPKSCPNNCLNEHTCCSPSCVGGCSAKNECTSCRKFVYNDTCTDTCPPDYYSYLDRRCLTFAQCIEIDKKFENKPELLLAFNGTCTTRCPENHEVLKKQRTCRKCKGKCIKKCPGMTINSIAAAKELQGCTHITTEPLTISIKRGSRHLMEELAFGLSAIVEIETYLKVHLTAGMYSLEFFKNLRKIQGKKLLDDRYSLYVLENSDLESIWAPNQEVIIERGRVFFHFNAKLCYSKIDALRPMMADNRTFDKNEVATDSNGSKGSCNTEVLNVTAMDIKSFNVTIQILNPLHFDDERTFIGYEYLYTEDKYKNASKHGHRPCDEGWIASEPTKSISYTFHDLLPYTQYAYYVKTWTISSEPRNAQSEIQYFRTKSAQPTFVSKIFAYANSSSEIVVTWLPPKNAHGKLVKYKIHAKLVESTPVAIRNYCKDPLIVLKDTEKPKNSTADISKIVTEKPLASGDCACPSEKSSSGTYLAKDLDDYSRHESMDFENALQNFIYVKQKTNDSGSQTDDEYEPDSEVIDNSRRRRRREIPSLDNGIKGIDHLNSYLVRHMRALPEELEYTGSGGGNIGSSSSISSSSGTTTAVPRDFTTFPPQNDTKMDPTKTYYMEFMEEVNATTNELVIRGLKHFSLYILGVEACREPEEGALKDECSQERQTDKYVRTLKLEKVDKVNDFQGELVTSNTTRSIIVLNWKPPERPNGGVVSYTISYLQLSPDAVEEKKCITKHDYQNLTNGYVLSGLATGNYSIRVRVNTLAGEGIYSDPIFINIPHAQVSTWLIVVGILLGVFSIVGIIVGVYCWRKMRSTPTDLQKLHPSVNPYYISLQYIPDEWEVTRERVIQLSPLGQGSFGMVYEGILKGDNNSNEDTPCAIKTVNENATDRERMNFLNEASVMKQFDTHHVVRLLGVCSRGQPALVIMELMKYGDLKSYLRAHRPDDMDDRIMSGTTAAMVEAACGGGLQPPPMSRIYQMAIEIADGMAYLAAKKFVHRDLAARNCMVANDLTVKIGDFGMTRDIYETDYYRKGTKGLLPVRWMPPESLRDGVYSSASDIFSYGVVLWEMVTLASQPYQGLSNDQVLRYVIDGGVMVRPENCPDKLYNLMQKCWNHRPSARPSFLEIIRYLLEHSEPRFREVSFYHSEGGQQMVKKETTEDKFNDHDADDATTPLRRDEYYFQRNQSKGDESWADDGKNGESPMIDDEHEPRADSPYRTNKNIGDPKESKKSLGSALIISSTPDAQSKNSYNPSQMSHNNPTTISSAPSISAGITSTSSTLLPHLPHTHPAQRQLHQPWPAGRYDASRPTYQRQVHLSGGDTGDEASAYVQPDFEPDEHGDMELGAVGRSVETDDRGYEIYDPSTNRISGEEAYDPADDEDEFSGRDNSRQSGRQNLLKQKVGRNPVIRPISSSVPDEMTSSAPMSSLHPSTASGASSNASSTTAPGKYPSLKKAVTDTVHNVGSSWMPTRFFNSRFFNHKRSGSNASHKSTTSNPNTSTNSNTNLTSGCTGTGRGKSMSQNLGTIESGGSGSAGSYCPAPTFRAPKTVITSENPNYQMLDESANASMISSAAAFIKTPAKTSTPARAGPKYQTLNESANVSENPNYQMMGPPPPATTSAAAVARDNNSGTSSRMPSQWLMKQQQQHSSSSDEFIQDDTTENIKMEQMPPGWRSYTAPKQQKRSSSSGSGSNRSRSRSRTKSDEKSTTTPTMGVAGPSTTRAPSNITLATTSATTLPTTTAASGEATSTQAQPSSTYFSMKEKWLNEQHQTKPPPPPPNGFIGREA